MISNRNLFIIGISLIGLSLVSMVLWDQSIALSIDSQFGSELDRYANFVTWFGLADTYFWISSIGYIVALLTEKYAYSKISRATSQKLKKTLKLMFMSFLISGLLVLILKFVIGRCRPYHSPVFDALYFKPFSFNWDFQSYPSGHTQVSFTLASFLAFIWPKISPLFFLLASIIALSRVILDYHYLGDVLCGSYIGILGFQLTLRYIASGD